MGSLIKFPPKVMKPTVEQGVNEINRSHLIMEIKKVVRLITAAHEMEAYFIKIQEFVGVREKAILYQRLNVLYANLNEIGS